MFCREILQNLLFKQENMSENSERLGIRGNRSAYELTGNVFV